MRQTQALLRVRSFFSLLKEAIVGKENTYTSGSLRRAIFLLAVPMILEMMMESLFAVVDIYFVSELGKAAVAAVGLTESMLTIVYSLAMGITMAASAMVARRIGEEDPKGASITAVQGMIFAGMLSLVISIVGFVFAKDLLRLMGATPEVIEIGHGYTQIMLGSNFVITYLFMINGIFRGAGNAAMAMRSLWLANILNIICCPIFIFGVGPIPAFGLEGAAIATLIGRGSGVLYQLYHLFDGKGKIKIVGAYFKPKWDIILQVLKIGASGAGQFLINSASWIILIRIIAQFGEDAIAGYTIGIRMVIFCLMPAWGLANAGATLVGQNLGAQQPERAEQSVYRVALYNGALLGIMSIILVAFAHPIIHFFVSDPNVVENAVTCLRVVSAGLLFYAFGMSMMQAFNGAGDTRTPMIINIFGFWLLQIPLAYALANWLALGPLGVYLAIGIAETLIAVAAFIVFKRGKWKLVKV
ncbi:putative MATE family efflux protein [Chitinophaga skermanii]|uniref:Multidrug-efflux transporter n=1 Tax=Chitinophaga skermanii TaxID=331697 RepID=A0A327QDH2_9BACT|nr:MATE family efflux transporter [Chitinophaga skermanii]RAJ01682.1 putative MATE family efflux protein [Chitinophaga skermanii]